MFIMPCSPSFAGSMAAKWILPSWVLPISPSRGHHRLAFANNASCLGASCSPSSSALRRGPLLASPSSDNNLSIQLYGQIERVFTDTAKTAQGTQGDVGRWEEIQGAWVIRPSYGVPIAIVHFIGGVFVGAAPQLTYRLFLEQLSERGFLVITTPFASGVDHLRLADEIQFKFSRCMMTLCDNNDAELQVFGVGHSLGALLQLLVGTRYAVQRRGNVLISFNNKEATSAIPLFSPVIVPMAQNMGLILSQLMTSPTIRLGTEIAFKSLESLSPSLVKQVRPLIEQVLPLYTELAKGKVNFTPDHDETCRLIRSYYGVGRNLLIKFKEDQIDETPKLAQILSIDSVVASYLDMSVRTLPGDHARPLQQVLPEVPSTVEDVVTRGSEFLSNLASGTPLEAMAKDVGQSIGTNIAAGQTRQWIIKDIEALVDEIADWMIASLK